MFDSNDPAVTCSELKKIAKKKKPSKSQRLAVEDQLQSKFEAVLMVTTDALANWGIRESIQPLIVLFQRLANKNHGSLLRYRVAEAIALLINTNDTQWATEFFISLPNQYARLDFAQVLERIMCASIEEKLVLAWKKSNMEEKKSLLYSTGKLSKRINQLALHEKNNQLRELLAKLPAIHQHGKKY